MNLNRTTCNNIRNMGRLYQNVELTNCEKVLIFLLNSRQHCKNNV